MRFSASIELRRRLITSTFSSASLILHGSALLGVERLKIYCCLVLYYFAVLSFDVIMKFALIANFRINKLTEVSIIQYLSQY